MRSSPFDPCEMERVYRNISSARGCHGLREVSQPLKRPQPAGRSAINVEEADGRSDVQHVGAKDGALTNRNGNNGDRLRASNGKGKKSLLYRIVVAIVAMVLLIETAIQASKLIRSAHFRHSSPRVSTPSKIISGDDMRLVSRNTVERLLLSKGRTSMTQLRNERRFSVRPTRLALLFTMKDGAMRSTWETLGVTVTVFKVDKQCRVPVDWLNYEGVIAVSLDTKSALTSLAQEPFKAISVIWVISDDLLAHQLRVYELAGAKDLIDDWKSSFSRADVVVFPSYALRMIYNSMDMGNFFITPGSPSEAWHAEEYMARHSRDSLRAQFGLEPCHFLIVVVGSPFVNHGLLTEHDTVMHALVSTLAALDATPAERRKHIHLFVMGHSNLSSSYHNALQIISEHVELSDGIIQYLGTDKDGRGTLWVSDAVVYVSLQDEQAFPPILIHAMSLQWTVIAPDLSPFHQYIVDGVSGLLFSPGDHLSLSRAIIRVILSEESLDMPSAGQSYARNLLTINATMSYGELLECILEFPVDAEFPWLLMEVPDLLKQGWYWDLIFPLDELKGRAPNEQFLYTNQDIEGFSMVPFEGQWMLLHTSSAAEDTLSSHVTASSQDEIHTLSALDLYEAKIMQVTAEAVQIEEGELGERMEHTQLSWEEVIKNVRKIELHKNELHKRSVDELECTGQPLSIYEPYYGPGAWPFLHKEKSLYRGLSLSTNGMRPGDDDVDAQLQLLVLFSNSYYHDALCEYIGFFALANHIDLVHKNAWIGFQPWQASSRKVSLSLEAEAALGRAMNTGKDGDALYFWARTNICLGASSQATSSSSSSSSMQQQHENFWRNCDSANAANCRDAFIRALRHMFGLPSNWTELPPMPAGGDTWSAMHCWALSTSSFVELVLFARIFVDALDTLYYEEHHDLGHCCFARSKHEGQHCYCRLLEGLVNVWAYHTAQPMIYVDPHTGLMQEQHPLESRKGQTWVRFFSLRTLKLMDEDLAQAADNNEDHVKQHWLWPKTGEVFWQGKWEREQRRRQKQQMKQKNKEQLTRI